MILPIFNKYIGGRNVKELNNIIVKLYKKNKWMPIVYHAKESSFSEKTINNSINTINNTINTLQFTKLSMSYALKYSSFNDYNKMDNVINDMFNKKNTKFVFIDSEDLNSYDNENIIFNKLIKKYPTKNLFKTYQMYRRDSLLTLQEDLFKYKSFGIKLVRGAYYNKQDNRLYNSIDDTHNAYNKALLMIINHIKNYNIRNINLLVATHNKDSIELVMNEIKYNEELKKNIFFGQLLGMEDRYSNILIKNNYKVFKYIPYGSVYETFPYLLRRFYENNYMIKYIL